MERLSIFPWTTLEGERIDAAGITAADRLVPRAEGRQTDAHGKSAVPPVLLIVRPRRSDTEEGNFRIHNALAEDPHGREEHHFLRQYIPLAHQTLHPLPQPESDHARVSGLPV